MKLIGWKGRRCLKYKSIATKAASISTKCVLKYFGTIGDPTQDVKKIGRAREDVFQAKKRSMYYNEDTVLHVYHEP